MAKIMVVEDEVVLFDLLREILRYEGYETLRPESSASLIQELRASGVAGVILDIYLKDVNGLDLLEEIRKDPELKDLYVMAISGIDHAREAKQKGADDFIMKPYMPADLVEILKQRINP